MTWLIQKVKQLFIYKLCYSELHAQFYESGLGCILRDFGSHGKHMIMTSLETMTITSSNVSKLMATSCHK